MAIVCRLMQCEDIPECAAIFAEHPLLAARYGETLSRLGEAWARVLGQLAFAAVVVEEANGERYRKVALGTRVFVSDRFMAEMKTSPFCWIGPEIVRRILSGESPLLTDRQVRENNSCGGVNLFAWDAAICRSDFGRQEIVHALFGEFVELHEGFLLKEFLSQSASSVEMLDAQLRSGDLLLGEDGRYTGDAPSMPLEELLRVPHYVGISRELAERDYTWVTTLFAYRPPCFGLRPNEQRLLTLALNGLTDAELAERLGISLSAVKKCWRRIYERIGAHSADLMPDACKSEGTHGRGAMKKQRLLAYLRAHIEELRPIV